MSGLRAATIESGGPLSYETIANLLGEARILNQSSGVNRKDQGPITPEEAVLIRKFLEVEEINPLAANKVGLDIGRKVLDVIGIGTSQPAVIYQAKEDDFKFHPKIGFKYRSRHLFGPGEIFGEALPIPESENLVETVASDFNTFVLDAVTIGAMPLVGAGNLIKSIEPAIRILSSKAKGEKISLSSEFKTLYETIADQSVMEASPVLSKALLGATALAVAFGPIASTIDFKSLGKAVHSKLELDKGISFNGPNGGPEIPKWAGPISLLVLLIAACQKALDGVPDPKVSIVTPTSTKLVPTETPRPATLTPVPSQTPEIAITPGSGGAGGPEFTPGSAVDLQLSVSREETLPSANCKKIDVSVPGLDTAVNLVKKELGLPESADVKGLIDGLKAQLNENDWGMINSLCVQGGGGWAIQLLNSQGEFLWAKIGDTWLRHPNRIPVGAKVVFESVGKPRNPNFIMKMVILNGQPWIVEFTKTGDYPQRYFDPAENAWREFSWNKFPGSEKLLGNPDLRIVDIKGDLSIKAALNTQEGLGGGFSVKSPDGSKQLRFTINRPKAVPLAKPTPELLVTLMEGSKVSELVRSTSLGSRIDGNDVLEVRFRYGTGQISIFINGREVKTVPAGGLTASGELLPGVIAGQDGKMVVEGLEVDVPNGGQRKGRENVKLLEVVPATPRPQFTPAPPTAVKPTPSPLLTPFKDSLGYTIIPVSYGPCMDHAMNGVWVRSINSNTETCFTGPERNPGLDAAVESWFRAVKAQGFSAANYTAGIIITQSIDGLINGTGSFHYSSSQFPYDELDGRLAALPRGTKLAFSYKRSQGFSSPNQMTAYAQLP